jgi:RNA-directed DNA polymerase
VERRGRLICGLVTRATGGRAFGRRRVGKSDLKSKSFGISKWDVQEAWEKVRAKKGAPGVDGCSVEDFEKDLKNNLYKIWNRMSSGSYFPPPVLAVEVPKPHGGGVRVLGVPTVADRVAQTVVARRLGREVEPIFHPGSWGYRPGRSPLDAVRTCRQRCWEADWVIDLDIQKFFDSVPWDLMVKAVEKHTDQPWVVLYVKRWLAAPLQYRDGTRVERDRGTPQGSAVSPVLANLFLHYAFDVWMGREFPGVLFERYVDDVVVHCRTRAQAEEVRRAIAARMEQVGLCLHPSKTKIVYCQDGRRRDSYEDTSFTFLGFTFRQRRARGKKGERFSGFVPAVSKDALKKIGAEVRSWRMHLRTGHTLEQLADWANPRVRGWMQYYGAFYRSALYPLLARINTYLVRWLRYKYKRLKTLKRTRQSWDGIIVRFPRLFAHWQWVVWVQRVW